MKKYSMTVLLAAALALPAFSYTPPTDDQIAQVVANHTQLNTLIQGASPEEAAVVVARAIASVQSSTLSPAGKTQATALLHTRALLLSGENAPKMETALAGQVDKSVVLPVAAASTAIAVGSTEGPVMASITQAAGAGSDAAKSVAAAAVDPASVLGADTVALVQQLVIELRGVAASVVPPPSTAPLNLVLPVVPRNVQQPTPPTATQYTGQ